MIDDDAAWEARYEYNSEPPEPTTRCVHCGNEWDEGYIPATRVDPPDCMYPECPECGGEGEAL